jgi:hypothetical protein
MPVVISPSVAEGKFLLGSFSEGSALFDREAMNVQISFENGDDFVKNMCTLRGELRSALAAPVLGAFLQGTRPAGSLTQTAPAHTMPASASAAAEKHSLSLLLSRHCRSAPQNRSCTTTVETNQAQARCASVRLIALISRARFALH